MNYNPYASPAAPPDALRYAPGGGGYSGGPLPVGVVLRQSWELFKTNAGTAIGSMFVVGFILAIPMFGPIVAVQWAYLGDAITDAIATTRHGGKPVFALPVAYYLWQPLLTVWMVAIAQVFGPGFARLNVAIARNESPGVGAVFSGFDRVPASIGWAMLTNIPALLAQGLLAAVALAGASPTVLQGLGNLGGLATLPVVALQALGLIFTPWFIADANLGPIAGAKAAWRATARYRGESFLLLLALAGINILGACACGVGLFVTMPWSMVALSYAYTNLPRG
jgi:uncharacterized membrane protein